MRATSATSGSPPPASASGVSPCLRSTVTPWRPSRPTRPGRSAYRRLSPVSPGARPGSSTKPIVNLPGAAAHRPAKTLSAGEGAVMKTLNASIAGIVLGLLAGCGGGYGGGGGGNGGPPATLNISIDNDSITLGESATITWASNANSCTASGDWTGMKAGDGAETVTPDATGTFTYSMTCSGGGYRDSQEGTVTLTVDPAVNVAALFDGDACCVDDAAVGVTVLTSRKGEFRLLTRGMQAVGQAGKPSLVFDASDSRLAGSRQADSQALERLAVTAQGSVRG